MRGCRHSHDVPEDRERVVEGCGGATPASHHGTPRAAPWPVYENWRELEEV